MSSVTVGGRGVRVAALMAAAAVAVAAMLGGGQGADAGGSLLEPVILAGITYTEVLQLLVLGFAAGTLGGMLGMGGGVLKMLSLHMFFGFDVVLCRVVSLLSYIVISMSSFVRYRQYGLILWSVCRVLIPTSMLGAVIGVVLGSWLPRAYVEYVLGIYSLIAAVMVANQIWTDPNEEEIVSGKGEETEDIEPGGAGACIGLIMGTVSAVVGISGGILSTPLQHSLLRVPLKNAIANSVTAAMFCSSTAAALLFCFGMGHESLPMDQVLLLTVCLVPGNVAGAQLGTYLTKRIDVNFVRVVFAVAALALGLKTVLF